MKSRHRIWRNRSSVEDADGGQQHRRRQPRRVFISRAGPRADSWFYRNGKDTSAWAGRRHFQVRHDEPAS